MQQAFEDPTPVLSPTPLDAKAGLGYVLESVTDDVPSARTKRKLPGA